MVLNFSFLVWVHVIISLVPLVSGVAVVRGLLAGRDSGWWTDIFFITVVLTTASGFILPAPGFTPALGLGIISTVMILAMLAARYRFGLRGAWRWVWSIGLMLSFYFDAFVLVTQLFTKVPALMRTTPVPGAPGGALFGAVQFVVLAVFVVLTVIAARRYRHAQGVTADVGLAGQSLS
ncbi:MAG: hypothetical protein JO055_00910 [Alphaproteobacteria bacterium]|nr:hypothetical protein [Alphaproteobacteria bacterium]